MNKTRKLIITTTFTSLYTALIYIFNSISFGVVQFRVADILYALTPIFGWPSIIGITLGVFLGNISSPLLPYDAFSCIFSLIGMTTIYKLRNKSIIAGLTIYSTILSLWIGLMLFIVIRIPFLVATSYVSIGIFASVYAGYPLYLALKRRKICSFL